MRIRSTKDFYAGLLFIFFGVLTLLIARSYPMGTTMHMGPGYFPSIVGGLLALLGLIVGVQALRFSGEAVTAWALRPLLLVILGVLAFTFLVEPLGLVLATLVLVVISSLGGWEFRPLEVAVLSLGLAALVVGIFIWGLRMPFQPFLK